MKWPRASRLETRRFVLEPLVPEHADEMADALAPAELYLFTGGESPTPESLRARYERQSLGHSPANDAGWLNWIIRVRTSQRAIGYVQVTLTQREGGLAADVAWLVTPQAQRGGVASEAATAMLTWLSVQEVSVVRALIDPEHEASNRVAERIGLVQTASVVEGESVWELRKVDARAS